MMDRIDQLENEVSDLRRMVLELQDILRPADKLSPLESNVLILRSHDLTWRVIASRLNVAVSTAHAAHKRATEKQVAIDANNAKKES